MKKIRIQLHGGLGNQLFIWAMAHEIQSNHSLKVELIYVSDAQQRTDRLNELVGLIDFCHENIVIRNSRIFGLLLRIIDKSSTIRLFRNVNLGKIFRFYECTDAGEVPKIDFYKIKFVRGFFQNATLVERHKAKLLEEINGVIDNLDLNSVCDFDQAIHIRRGDTLDIAESWGVINFQYYRDQISQKKKLVICTDDSNLAHKLKEQYPNAHISTPRTESTWQTLGILSRSKELIGANSTLSWWAAWLSISNGNEKAVLPKPWRPIGFPQQYELLLNGVTYRQPQFDKEF